MQAQGRGRQGWVWGWVVQAATRGFLLRSGRPRPWATQAAPAPQMTEPHLRNQLPRPTGCPPRPATQGCHRAATRLPQGRRRECGQWRTEPPRVAPGVEGMDRGPQSLEVSSAWQEGKWALAPRGGGAGAGAVHRIGSNNGQQLPLFQPLLRETVSGLSLSKLPLWVAGTHHMVLLLWNSFLAHSSSPPLHPSPHPPTRAPLHTATVLGEGTLKASKTYCVTQIHHSPQPLPVSRPTMGKRGFLQLLPPRERPLTFSQCPPKPSQAHDHIHPHLYLHAKPHTPTTTASTGGID